MKVQQHRVDSFAEVWEFEDPPVNFHAFISLHSLQRGPALGGVRFWNYPNPQAALDDSLRLARAMTYKAAIADLPHGGGKAVLIKPKQDFDRAILMQRFGQAITSLSGRYITAKDVGTHAEDMAMIRQETQWATGLPKAQGGAGDPSPLTAYGVLVGLETSWHKLHNSHDLQGVRIIIQGLGGVGSTLAKLLSDRGAKLYASDLQPKHLKKMQQHLGITPVDSEEVYQQEAEIFAPCAMGQVLNSNTIPQLKINLVAGAANDQLADETKDAKRLQQKNILYAPDFVLNSGGLIHVAMELSGDPAESVQKKVEQIGPTLEEIFKLSDQKSISPLAAAMLVAKARL